MDSRGDGGRSEAGPTGKPWQPGDDEQHSNAVLAARMQRRGWWERTFWKTRGGGWKSGEVSAGLLRAQELRPWNGEPQNTPTYPHRATLFTSFYLMFWFCCHVEPAGLDAQSSAQLQAPRMVWGGAGQLRGPMKNARPRPLSR